MNFGSQLHGAWIVPPVDLAKRAACDVGVNRVRIAVVECVEGFQSKLQGYAFAELYIFYQRDVPQLKPWSQNGAGSFRAEVSDRRNESRRVEELRRSLRS